MIAFDTNLLVYAHREDSTWHEAARSLLTEEAESGRPWCIPWPCLHEFLAVVTHPRIFDPPTPLKDALEAVRCWLEVPTLRLLSESPGYWEHLESLVSAGKVTGPRIHDAHVAALCRAHGVDELWAADRDFSGFPGLRSRNPMVG